LGLGARCCAALLALLVAAGCEAGLASARAKAKHPSTAPAYCRASTKRAAVDRARGARKRRHKRPASKAACAPGKLVAELASAHTTARRVSVLTSIVGDSALGVYKPNGKRVLGGAERGAKDLYLYTFQLTSLADQRRC
jgi:hypothetical protein